MNNIETAKKVLKEHKLAIIIENEHHVGILTVRDYLKGLYKYQNNLKNVNVGSLMSPNMSYVNPDLDIYKVNDFMIKKGYKYYPVGFGDKVLGIVTRKQILKEIYNSLVKN